jgi:hypothetical protein
MSTPSPDLFQELADVRARLATLEAERVASRRRVRRLLSATVLAALVGTAASAANGACPNGLPFCFAVETPAIASEVNTNFAQLKEWLEGKVGAVATPVRITSGATVSTITPPTQATRALFVSANTTAFNEPIVDFRHDNLTQGVGIGWSSVLATGTTPNQDLFLVAKGTGRVVSNSAFDVGCAIGPCFCPAGTYPLSWVGTCENAGVAVYSSFFVTNASGQRGIDVRCINQPFNATIAQRNMQVLCSRLITP